MGQEQDLKEKLKLALDETRMSIMGVHILVGFQLQAVVQESFATLPLPSKFCIGGALILMVLTVGLLISPAAQHRLVESGDASARMAEMRKNLVGPAAKRRTVAKAKPAAKRKTKAPAVRRAKSAPKRRPGSAAR